AISNIVLKKIVRKGFNRLVFITYRQSVSAIFITPLAFFVERFEILKHNMFTIEHRSYSMIWCFVAGKAGLSSR
ncbi:hypothetical protein PSY31_22700, partial [Shigella flexneri]|nr:hypothetical protein [Shigella flexneri]